MAKDDYYIIAYRLMAYLYSCLKAGEKQNIDYIYSLSDVPTYFDYILVNLYNDGYLEGIVKIPLLGSDYGVRVMPDVMITPKGIEFLQTNSAMSKAKDFLKTVKEVIPGL